MPEETSALSAFLFDIYRGTSHDGPGLRTTAFFSGCPLQCEWCHNPEGIGFTPVSCWEAARCIGCGECLLVCPSGALSQSDERIKTDTVRCIGCGACAQTCPSRALMMTARQYTVEKLLDELKRDELIYRKSGGGVTVSGGECLMQHGFLRALLKGLKAQGIHTALDTCGHVQWSAFESVLEDTDLVLYDIKLMDGREHRRFTGQGNERILSNLKNIARRIRLKETAAEIWIRTPLIPGATATEENISAIGQFIAAQLEGAVTRWELPAFNNSGVHKYRRLGLDWPYADKPPITKAQAAAFLKAAAASGLSQDQIAVTGILAT